WRRRLMSNPNCDTRLLTSWPTGVDKGSILSIVVPAPGSRVNRNPPRNALSLLPRDQHNSEASFVSDHPSVSFGSICQRNGFDHRTDLLQGAKRKSVRSRVPPRFEQEGTE